METKIIFQRIKHTTKGEMETAVKYYRLLSVINNLKLTAKEVQLIAFTAINGSISLTKNKEIFCKEYSTTMQTISNLICSLKKKNILVKNKDKVEVNPIVVIDFKKSLKLEINLEHEQKA